MKMIMIALTLLISSAISAETINYDVFKTEKKVESVSSMKGLKFFDFKLKKIVTSKTVIPQRCDNSRYGNHRDDRQYNCDQVTTTKEKVAQLIISYRPTGTTDRHGEVTNGKKVNFVKFNISLNDLSEDDMRVLKSKRGFFTSKKKFKRLANKLYEISSYRIGHRLHSVSISRK